MVHHSREMLSARARTLGSTTMSVRGPEPHREIDDSFASLLVLAPTEAGATKAADTDYELFACCAEAETLYAAANELGRADTGAVEEANRTQWESADADEAPATADDVAELIADALRRASQLPARTPESLRAKAALLLFYLGEGDAAVHRCNCNALAISLARDIAGRR